MRWTVLLVFLASVAFGWLVTDTPEGHIESTAISDGKVYAHTTTSITTLTGTFQKGGSDQTYANAALASRAIYMAFDRNRDGAIDAYDEPLGSTTLNGGIDDAVTTITVNSTSGFLEDGNVLIGTELIHYTGKTSTTFTGCTRGYNETSAASHLTAAAVTAVMAWEKVASANVDGTVDAVGWDATYQADDGTEGDILQGETITTKEGCSYLLKLRVIDAVGNTNTEVGGSDVFHSYGSSSYCGQDGDVAQGLEDDEVLWIRVNRRVGR